MRTTSSTVVGGLAVLCLLCAMTASAAVVPDPKIVIAGSGYSTPLYDLDFTFSANGTGGGTYDFYNASGVDWGELHISTAMPWGYVDDIWVPLDDPIYYSLTTDLFLHTAVSFETDSLTLDFFGLDEQHPGIRATDYVPPYPGKDDSEPPWGSHFSIALDDGGIGTPPGVGGWFGENHDPLVFGGTAVPVPEPATFALLGAGLIAGATLFRRRR